MNICSLHFQLLYDLRQGILARWKWYLTAVLIFALQWMTAYRCVLLLKTADGAGPVGTYMDYVLFCFRGLAPKTASTFGNRFELPMLWICVFVGSLVSSLGYSGTDTNDYSIQIAVRVGSRKIWWFSKCLWCAFSTLLYFFAAYLTLAILCTIMKIPLSLSNTPEFSSPFLSSERFIAHQPISLAGNIQIGFVMPFLFAFLLNLIQLTLSLFFSQTRSFLVCIVVLILSAYYTSRFAIGNYAMVMRSSYVIEKGFNPQEGQVVIIFLFLLLGAVGFKKINHLDFLPRSKERG